MKQMKWHSPSPNTPKILYIRVSDVQNGAWLPYTAFSHLAVPDHQVPKGSKGWATFQKLLKAGFELIPSDQE